MTGRSRRHGLIQRAGTHINQIFAKTSSRDRAQAIVYAHHHGLTLPGPGTP